MLNFKNLKKKIIVAEVGLSYYGKLDNALKLIDKVSNSGADAIKFQTHYADSESTVQEKFRKGHKFRFKTRYDYWKSHELEKNEWVKIKEYCKRKKILFSSSPFSVKSFKVLKTVGVDFWKIGSGEFYSDDLFNLILKTNKPIVLSTGLSSYKEVNERVKLLKKRDSNFLITQCTTKYPTSLKEVGVNVINEFEKKFQCPVGLSDHSGTIYPSIYSICDNVTKLVEIHVSRKNDLLNPDRTSSISFSDLKLICNIRGNVELLKNSKINKDQVAKKLNKTRKLFTKSLALNKNLKKGSIIKLDDLCLKKPGTGIRYKYLKKIVGKKLKKNLSDKVLIKWSHFD